MSVEVTDVEQLEIERILPGLEGELSRWKNQRDRLDARISARERLVDALKAEVEFGRQPLFLALSDEVSVSDSVQVEVGGTNGNGAAPTRPDTGDAILRVLNGAGRRMTKAAIFEELEARGWAPDGKHPKAAVGSALWYLRKQGAVEKFGEGHNTEWARKSFAPPEGGAKDTPAQANEEVMS